MQEQHTQNSDCHPEHSNPDNWYLGILYYAPKDPNVMVPKRWGPKWGATVNFAHMGAYLVVGTPFVLGMAIAACVAWFGR